MIYSQLTEMNQTLKNIESTMSAAFEDIHKMKGDMTQLVKNSKIIAYNSEKTAYYAKRNAELTNALGFMVAFK